MKTRFFAALAAVALFTSCQKDFSAEYGSLNQTSTTTTTNALGVNNCKASPYFPVCTGSEYKYTDTRGAISLDNAQGAPMNYSLTYLGDTTIERKTFQKIKGYSNQVTYFNSTDGVLTQIILNVNPLSIVALPYFKYTIVKSNESVGARWRDVINLPNDPSEINDYTIVAKGLTRTVSGITYNDVIQIRQDVTSANYGVTPYLHIDQYMAKGVGLIESVSYTDYNGASSIMVHHKLISAIVPQ
jgi:hypothetical protein